MTPFHTAWLEAAVAALVSRHDVIGVVGMGSTGAAERADEWSDHDVAIVVHPGAEGRYRHSVDWMPDAGSVVLHIVEHHGGGKAMYADGHVVEWGVATLASLEDWVADDYKVLLDRGGVADVMERIATRPWPSNRPDLATDAGNLVILLRIGLGRLRRGEVLSAQATIRGEAVQALLRALRAASAPSPAAGLDRLDGLRRIERAYPEASAVIAAALDLPAEDAAWALLDLAKRLLGEGPVGLPPAAVAALEGRFGRRDLVG